VGTWDIGASRAAPIPQMRDFQTILGAHNDPPPEPGSARREAHCDRNPGSTNASAGS
jgi:hypothetical protein